MAALAVLAGVAAWLSTPHPSLSYRLGNLLIIEGFMAFVIGLVGVIRGRITWAHIRTRKMAGLVTGVAVGVVIAGVTLVVLC